MNTFELPLKLNIKSSKINDAFGISSERANQLADKINNELEAIFTSGIGVSDIDICQLFVKYAETVNESYFLVYQAGRITESFHLDKDYITMPEKDVPKNRMMASGGSC